MIEARSVHPNFCSFASKRRASVKWPRWMVPEVSTCLRTASRSACVPFRFPPNYFQLLGVTAEIGRTFIPGDDHLDQKQIVILSQNLWQRRFGMDPGIVGKTIQLDGEKYIVVGVMPASFKQTYYSADLWIPLALSDGQRTPQAHAPR